MQRSRQSLWLFGTKESFSIGLTLVLCLFLSLPTLAQSPVTPPVEAAVLFGVRGAVTIVGKTPHPAQPSSPVMPHEIIMLPANSNVTIVLAPSGQRYRANGPARIRVDVGQIRLLAGTAPKPLPPLNQSLLKPLLGRTMGGVLSRAVAIGNFGGVVNRGGFEENNPLTLVAPIGVQTAPVTTLRWQATELPEGHEILVTVRETTSGLVAFTGKVKFPVSEIPLRAAPLKQGALYRWTVHTGAGSDQHAFFRVLSPADAEAFRTGETAIKALPRAFPEDTMPDEMLMELYRRYATPVEVDAVQQASEKKTGPPKPEDTVPEKATHP